MVEGSKHIIIKDETPVHTWEICDDNRDPERVSLLLRRWDLYDFGVEGDSLLVSGSVGELFLMAGEPGNIAL